MAAPQPAPELMSLFGPSTLSPMRVFASFVVLLAVLLITRFSPRQDRTRKLIAVDAKRRGTRTVLLVGPLASGKTSLFAKLVYGHAPQTFTSMKENEATVTAKWGVAEQRVEDDKVKDEKAALTEDEAGLSLRSPVHLVDLPGHARLRTRALSQYLPAADGIVFAVDGQGGLTGKNVRDAGEHFHILLSLLSLLTADSSRSSSAPPILVLLTKNDLVPASSSSSSQLAIDRAKQLLLRELERRRLASSGAGSASALARGSGVTTGSARPHSAGARLDGLEAIPSGGGSRTGSGASGSLRGILDALLSTLGLSSSSSSPLSTGLGGALSASEGRVGGGLPSDESEVLALAADDVFAFDGIATWDKLERAVGCEIKWAVASVHGRDTSRKVLAEQGTGKGLAEVYEWLEDL